MKLKRLKIDRLPGIDMPFEIESPGAGVHIIFGPNAIGKSSICRAVEGLYWDDRGPTERTSVTFDLMLFQMGRSVFTFGYKADALDMTVHETGATPGVGLG